MQSKTAVCLCILYIMQAPWARFHDCSLLSESAKLPFLFLLSLLWSYFKMDLPFPEPSYLPCLAFPSKAWQLSTDKFAVEDIVFQCQCSQKEIWLIIISILVSMSTVIMLLLRQIRMYFLNPLSDFLQGGETVSNTPCLCTRLLHWWYVADK